MQKFLIVDDQEDFLMLLQERLLGLCPSTVTSARSGRDAIRLLEMGFKFDLIVCDFQMPDGNGKLVFEYVQRFAEPVPFILHTGSSQLPSFHGSRFLGVVPKGNLRDLTDLIRSQVKSSR